MLLKVKIADDPRFSLDGHDLKAVLKISPWEAGLGAKVPFQTLDGEVKLTIPPGSQSGRKLRLKGKGLKKKRGAAGDLHIELKVVLPDPLSDRDRALLEEWRAASDFDPRAS